MYISVIIPTYNPDSDRLHKTLMALKGQTLPLSEWQLILVNNNSTIEIKADISWHPEAKMVFEPMQGLTNARVKGFKEARGDIILMVDDDNTLSRDYLKNVVGIFMAHPKIGAIGGKSLPLFEIEPPDWLNHFYGNLALRDLGNNIIIDSWQHQYPSAAPIGAGMAFRKSAIVSYINAFEQGNLVATDRTGRGLTSGGDNEIIISILRSGWLTGYFPDLVLHHLIPKERTNVDYLARLSHDINLSWVRLLDRYGINPWKKFNKQTLKLRKIKAFIQHRAWAHSMNYIKWRAACGLLEGLAK